MVHRVALVAGLLLAASAPGATNWLDDWSHTYPEARTSFETWSGSFPTVSRLLSQWEAEHPKRFQFFLRWAVAHPDGTPNQFQSTYPDWPAVGRLLARRRALEQFMAWAHAHPGAATELAKEPGRFGKLHRAASSPKSNPTPRGL